MRPLLLIVLSSLLLLQTNLLFAQSFEKHDKVIYSGIKISIYSTNDGNTNTDDNDGIASYTIPIGFEYALSNRIGAGVELGICNYFTGEDTLTGAIADASSFDVLFTGNFHWVRGGRVDLFSGVGLGFSNFKYESNDSKDSHYTATGAYLQLSMMNARFYLGKTFALTLHFGIPYMNFESGRIEDNIGNDYNYPLSFIGIDLGTGIAFRF